MQILATTTAALLILGACGERARFRPTPDVHAKSPSGRPAASYALRADETSAPQITVNVWSEGARRDGGRTFVDLSVEIRNTGGDDVALDREALALEAFNSEGTPLPAARLAGADVAPGGPGVALLSFTVPPRDARTIRLRFELGVPVSPSHVGGLRLRWGVAREDGERYVQFTEFRQAGRAAAAGHVHHDPVFGFYDPYFYAAPYGHHFNYHVPVGRVSAAR